MPLGFTPSLRATAHVERLTLDRYTEVGAGRSLIEPPAGSATRRSWRNTKSGP
jgi:hypothetical protein